MSKHTEGPWEADGFDVWATKPMRFTSKSAGTPLIATAARHLDFENPFPYLANARLIAAAPEMLAALERTLNWLSSYPGGNAEGTYQQARAAIAKATGEKA